MRVIKIRIENTAFDKAENLKFCILLSLYLTWLKLNIMAILFMDWEINKRYPRKFFFFIKKWWQDYKFDWATKIWKKKSIQTKKSLSKRKHSYCSLFSLGCIFYESTDNYSFWIWTAFIQVPTQVWILVGGLSLMPLQNYGL